MHVSIGGKIYDAVERAGKLGCSAMQIFSRNPRQWRSLGLSAADAAEFRRRRAASGLKAVAVHIPYLINLATPRDALYHKSIDAYVEDVREAQALGAEYLVTHMGSFKDSSAEAGLSRFTQAIGIVLERTRGSRVMLLLENTTGAGHWLGAMFQDHARVMKGVRDRGRPSGGGPRLGVCLDTAHLFGAGHDIREAAVFDAVLDDIERRCGRGAVRVVHLNDSAGDLGSLVDRHASIGKGRIGLKAFSHIVNHPKLRNAAFILETPKTTPREDALNLRRVRKLIQ
ncbi:MAG: deoxyribonuclease IV [Deltaproteobacteria bacterium]